MEKRMQSFREAVLHFLLSLSSFTLYSFLSQSTIPERMRNVLSLQNAWASTQGCLGSTALYACLEERSIAAFCSAVETSPLAAAPSL